MLYDIVKVLDSGVARLRDKAGSLLSQRDWGSDKTLVHVEGWVETVMRERGKIVPGSRREGKNIWTNTGREYLALRMSLEGGTTPTPFRSDYVKYLGVGVGSRVEDASVLSLADPVESLGGIFLVPFDVPPTFPLTPTRTTVRYSRTFSETEITINPGVPVLISELGMFTSGDPSTPKAAGPRDTSFGARMNQAPVAYKSLEPFSKTDAFSLEVSWEIRF